MDIGSAIAILFGLLFVGIGLLNYYLTAGCFGKNSQEATGVDDRLVVEYKEVGNVHFGGVHPFRPLFLLRWARLRIRPLGVAPDSSTVAATKRRVYGE
jgi:hypothetical protein